MLHEADPESMAEDVRAWPDYLRWMNKRANRQHWTGNLPQFDTSNSEEVAMVREDYGDNADLLLKVSAVVRAVRFPPSPEQE